MTFEDLKKKIIEVSNSQNISEQQIISGTIASLDLKYQPKIYSFEDRKIKEDLKIKILSRLYEEPFHKKSINHATKYDVLFGADQIEMKLLNDTYTELEAENLVFSEEFEIGLTEEGIRKIR